MFLNFHNLRSKIRALIKFTGLEFQTPFINTFSLFTIKIKKILKYLIYSVWIVVLIINLDFFNLSIKIIFNYLYYLKMEKIKFEICRKMFSKGKKV